MMEESQVLLDSFMSCQRKVELLSLIITILASSLTYSNFPFAGNIVIYILLSDILGRFSIQNIKAAGFCNIMQFLKSRWQVFFIISYNCLELLVCKFRVLLKDTMNIQVLYIFIVILWKLLAPSGDSDSTDSLLFLNYYDNAWNYLLKTWKYSS